MRLNHVTLPASDVEASAEFYRRLGLTQIVASYPDYARFVSPEGGVTLSFHLDEAGVPSDASTASSSTRPARCA
jgi:catechol 2,3-dioxygenase-like lactoylglutathione lyase family enzyme